MDVLCEIACRWLLHAGREWELNIVLVKLTVAELAKNLPAIYGTRTFIVVFERAR